MSAKRPTALEAARRAHEKREAEAARARQQELKRQFYERRAA